MLLLSEARFLRFKSSSSFLLAIHTCCSSSSSRCFNIRSVTCRFIQFSVSWLSLLFPGIHIALGNRRRLHDPFCIYSESVDFNWLHTFVVCTAVVGTDPNTKDINPCEYIYCAVLQRDRYVDCLMQAKGAYLRRGHPSSLCGCPI